jgi:CubicO group peptidase (beta-lactamase class C family)
MLAYPSHPADLPGWRKQDQIMTLGFRVLAEPAAGTWPLSKGSISKGGSFGTQCFIDPSEALIGILMVQTRNRDRRLIPEFFEIIYGAIAD